MLLTGKTCIQRRQEWMVSQLMCVIWITFLPLPLISNEMRYKTLNKSILLELKVTYKFAKR